MAEARPAQAGELYTPLGSDFTPSMLTGRFTPERGWHDVEVGPRQPLQLDPATMALHYGQAAFEGLKAYRQPDGGLALFRCADHAQRLADSCRRLAIPPLPHDLASDAWRLFCRYENPNLAPGPHTALYLRPLVFGTDLVLGARPSAGFELLLLGIQITDGADQPRRRLEVLVTTEFVRAAPGGVGAAKTPANYAAGMLAQKVAFDHGCDQVLWLDAGRRRWVEELGSMNVMFVLDDTLVTPQLTDTILDGVTRRTILTLAREAGLAVEERPIALEELTAAMSWHGLTEAFACSTGAGITNIGGFQLNGNRLALPDQSPLADRLRGLLEDVQFGRAADPHGWRTVV